MKKFLTILTLLLCVGTLRAENRKEYLDSLQSCLLHSPNDTTRAKILTNIGTFYMDNGGYPKAIENLLQALRIFEKAGNQFGVFDCQNRLGVTYSYTEDYKTALDYLTKAKPGIDDGRLYDNLGLIYYNVDYGKSLFNYKQSLDFYRSKSDTILVARLLNDIGSIYEEHGEIDTAIFYYNECLKTSKDKMNMSGAYASLGDIYFGLKNYSLALEYENKSLGIAKEINNLFSVRETEKVLSDIYSAMGNPTKSLEHYKNFISIRDSLVNENNIKQVTRLEENFKFDKERELTGEKLQNQKNLRNVFILGFAIVIVFSVFLFRAFKRNQRAKIIITEQKKIVDEKKKEMTDNINYAQRIQKAILPSDEYINNLFPDNFIINKPKDIVSGDFYWAYNDVNGNKYFATADCTGHGASASMISMIGTQLLNKIVIENKITSPDLVLNSLRADIIKALNREGAEEERKDGMDISFVKINDLNMECACANNSIYVVRKGDVIEIKADRMPIGKYAGEEKPFTLHTLNLQREDVVYTLSDGFQDQFGGEKGKKLMIKRLKEWMAELSNLNMADIKDKLETRFNNWVGEGEQTDDVTIMAIKI